MLEFIVLGQIPGTNLVVTFKWVVIAAAFLVVCLPIFLANLHRFRKLIRHIQQVTEIAL